MPFRLNAFGLSDVGKVRAVNEDSMLLRNEAGLWAVADGMGGHANGKWASQHIVDALGAAPLSGDFSADMDVVADTIQEVNSRIVAAAEEAGTTMGSTVAILLLSGERFSVLWAGDSRAYVYRDAVLAALTADHTYVNELVAAGAITPEQAKGHPNKHVISRAVGVTAALQLEAVCDDVKSLDVFLLCSDGLTGTVSDAELRQALDRAPPRSAARELLDLALSRGAPDNVTVIVVGCEEVTRIVQLPREPSDV